MHIVVKKLIEAGVTRFGDAIQHVSAHDDAEVLSPAPACVRRYSATNRDDTVNHRAGRHDRLHTIVDLGVDQSHAEIDQLRKLPWTCLIPPGQPS